jgi:hypothetical protein
MLDNLRPLTQEQRQTARQAARQAVVQSTGIGISRILLLLPNSPNVSAAV